MLKQTSIFVLFTALFLTACGQSGALYFPESKEAPPIETSAEQDENSAVKTSDNVK